MPYIAPVDLMIQLGFTPGDCDSYRYAHVDDAENGYLMVTFGAKTGILILSDNWQVEDSWSGAIRNEKRLLWQDPIPSFIAFLELLTESLWELPATFKDEEEFVTYLHQQRYLTEDDLI